MGASIYIVLEKDDVDFDWYVDGKVIANVAEEIENLCKEHNLKSMGDYISHDESAFMAEEFGLEDIEPTEPKWFDAQEGIDLVNSLLQTIKAKNIEFKTDYSMDEVKEELQYYIEVLEKAKEFNIKWHFDYDY